MKIDERFQQCNLIQTNQDKNIGTRKQIKECTDLFPDVPVKVDLSAEGIAQYRKTIQANMPDQEEEKKLRIVLNDSFTSINYNMEISARVNEINRKKGNATVKARAQSIMEAYASLYAEIVEGHENGTRNMFTESYENRPLTKEEELEKLNQAFEDYTDFFERCVQLEQEHAMGLEKEIVSVYKKYGAKKLESAAQAYQQAIAAKTENPEQIPPNIGELILNAGKLFLTNVSSLNSINHKSVMGVVSAIKIW